MPILIPDEFLVYWSMLMGEVLYWLCEAGVLALTYPRKDWVSQVRCVSFSIFLDHLSEIENTQEGCSRLGY